MADGTYIFDNASEAAELERLRILEAVFDGKTCDWLRSAGLLLGHRCLEVGAGAGSIAVWMGSVVGPTGKVLALDSNARFLQGLGPQVEVVQGELQNLLLPDESFDIVHARYVLIHNADAENVLATMLRALKPGGLLVLEEPDFSAAAALVGPPHWRQAFENVKRAIDAVFSGRGMTYAFGRTLPGLLQQTKASLSHVEYDCVVNRGGSGLAEMMRRSTLALEDKYVGTGYATPEDIAGYAGFASSHDCWGIYYATVRALARKMAG